MTVKLMLIFNLCNIYFMLIIDHLFVNFFKIYLLTCETFSLDYQGVNVSIFFKLDLKQNMIFQMLYQISVLLHKQISCHKHQYWRRDGTCRRQWPRVHNEVPQLARVGGLGGQCTYVGYVGQREMPIRGRTNRLCIVRAAPDLDFTARLGKCII